MMIKSPLIASLATIFASFFISLPQEVNGQGLGSSSLSPISLTAQATAPPQYIPTDVTPFTVTPERNSFGPGFKFKFFQALPARLWFNFTTESSQRLDTNCLFTYSNPKANYAYRILPNLTAGYNITRNTSLFGNYFLIKDVFARNYSNINFPTTQSLSWGIQHNHKIGLKSNLQFAVQARELWQTAGLHQFDFLPGVTYTHAFNANNILWGSTLLQLRGGDYFVAPTREIDPFYTIGYMHRYKLWALVINDTLVTNFRHPPFNDSIPPQSNVSMITDIEINHPVCKKFPGMLAFLRAEPIWNWDSHKAAGISGFDFRLYTGIRFTMNKPSYYGAMNDMRKQLMQSEAAPVSNTALPPSPSSAPLPASTAAPPPASTIIPPPATSRDNNFGVSQTFTASPLLRLPLNTPGSTSNDPGYSGIPRKLAPNGSRNNSAPSGAGSGTGSSSPTNSTSNGSNSDTSTNPATSDNDSGTNQNTTNDKAAGTSDTGNDQNDLLRGEH